MEMITGIICLTIVVLVKEFFKFADAQEDRRAYYEKLGELEEPDFQRFSNPSTN